MSLAVLASLMVLHSAVSETVATDDVFQVTRQSHGRWTYTYGSDGDQFVNLEVFASASDGMIFDDNDDGYILIDDETITIPSLSAMASVTGASAAVTGDLEAYTQLEITDTSYDAEVNTHLQVGGSLSGDMADVAFRGEDPDEVTAISFNRLRVGPGNCCITEGTANFTLKVEWNISNSPTYQYIYAFYTDLTDRPDSWLEADLLTGYVSGSYSTDTTANPTSPQVVDFFEAESTLLGDVTIVGTTVVEEDQDIELYTSLGGNTLGMGPFGPLEGGETVFNDTTYSADIKATAKLTTISD